MAKVIGFSGPRGVGKNYVADQFRDHLQWLGHVVRMRAFADPLKEYCINILGLKRELVYGDNAAKEALTEYRWEAMPIRAFAPCAGYMTVREVLQFAGTELHRNIWGPDIWVNCTRRRIDAAADDYVLITDVRFANEAKLILDSGGIILMVYRPGGYYTADAHASEDGFDTIMGMPGTFKFPNQTGGKADPVFMEATIRMLDSAAPWRAHGVPMGSQ